jgi:hypothetical protein
VEEWRFQGCAGIRGIPRSPRFDKLRAGFLAQKNALEMGHYFHPKGDKKPSAD